MDGVVSSVAWLLLLFLVDAMLTRRYTCTTCDKHLDPAAGVNARQCLIHGSWYAFEWYNSGLYSTCRSIMSERHGIVCSCSTMTLQPCCYVKHVHQGMQEVQQSRQSRTAHLFAICNTTFCSGLSCEWFGQQWTLSQQVVGFSIREELACTDRVQFCAWQICSCGSYGLLVAWDRAAGGGCNTQLPSAAGMLRKQFPGMFGEAA